MQMIHPNLATMLGVVTTDAAISPDCLQAATRYAVDRSFNAISVDGDMSTNDTVVVLANGQSPQLQPSDAITSTDSPAYAAFQRSLTAFCIELSQKLVRDGEGATKFVTIEVRNAASFAEARQVCSSIATSALVKTAMYGQDANWGRIVCAVGYSGVDVDPNAVSLWFVDQRNDSSEGNLHLLRNGQPYQTDEERATELVRRPEIHIRIDLGTGREAATMWTCDFSRQHHQTHNTTAPHDAEQRASSSSTCNDTRRLFLLRSHRLAIVCRAATVCSGLCQDQRRLPLVALSREAVKRTTGRELACGLSVAIDRTIPVPAPIFVATPAWHEHVQTAQSVTKVSRV